MSGMANEMGRRMADDGHNVGAAPGNADVPPDPSTSPAGESNADTVGGQGPPDTIPYARFKEVNDSYQRLRGYEDLEQYGYDADTLRRLAAFETGYMQDPYGTVKLLAENLDLPQEVLDGIDRHAASVQQPDRADQGNGRAEGESDASGDQRLRLSPEDQQRLEYVDQLREQEIAASREASLQAVVRAWDSLDETDNVTTPERFKLVAIATAAQSGQEFRTHEDLAKAAREYAIEFRSSVLGEAIQGTGHRGAPPALPAGAPASSGPLKFKNLREASKAAEAAMARGELPPILP